MIFNFQNLRTKIAKMKSQTEDLEDKLEVQGTHLMNSVANLTMYCQDKITLLSESLANVTTSVKAAERDVKVSFYIYYRVYRV